MIQPPTADNIWYWLISVVLTGGIGRFAVQAVRDWRNRPMTVDQHVSSIDASIITVARARDELAEDNTRLRQMIVEERERWDAEREAWSAERLTLRNEIASLETLIRRERAESAARYDALLQRLSDLSARHASTEGPTQ